MFHLCDEVEIYGTLTRRATRTGDDLRLRLAVDQGLPADLCPSRFPLDTESPRPDWTDLVITGSTGDADGYLSLVPRGEVLTLRGTAPISHTPIGALTVRLFSWGLVLD